MGQSLVRNSIHIIFSTKHREPIIYPPYETELHSYIASICNGLESSAICVGGFIDHVHILCNLSKKVALMDLVEEVKRASSKWMKTKDDTLKHFYWQGGYGAFSVSSSQIEKVQAYIANQHEHHRSKSYQEEYRAFLKRYNVEFDERYVWD